MPDLGCSPEAKRAFDFLVSRGLSDFQAAAVVGNLQQESAFNTRAFNSSEGSYGIAQWRLNRWQNLLAFAQTSGRDPWQLETQLDFLWNELSTIPNLGLSALLSSSSLEAAVVVFQDQFERCGACNTNGRVAFARAALTGCPLVQPPTTAQVSGPKVLVVAGVLTIVSAAAYGAYRFLSRPAPAPEPPRPPWGVPDGDRFYYRRPV